MGGGVGKAFPTKTKKVQTMGPNTARLDTIEIRDFWPAQESGDKGGRRLQKQKTGELGSNPNSDTYYLGNFGQIISP